MIDEFPRVLVVNGEPFNSRSATGITMSNLFHDWPADRVFQVYTANIPPDIALCHNNIQLSGRNLKPLCYFCANFGESSNCGDKGGRFFQHDENSGNVSISRRLVGRLRPYLSPIIDFFPYRLTQEDFLRIQNFKPDIIYSMLGSIRIVRLVDLLAKKFNIPVVPHFMDDWLSTYAVPGRSFGSSFHVRYLQYLVARLFNSIPIGLSIGELMAEEYSRKFSCEFRAFMNPVEVNTDFPQQGGSENPRPVRFVYVGGLHLGRFESLSDIAQVLQRLKTDDVQVELRIYAPLQDATIARQLEEIGAVVAYEGSIKPCEVHDVLKENDVAIHVESFHPSCSEYTRLSVSTKIPQYFAAGIPVLAYGPSSLASCRYIKSTGSGVLVEKNTGNFLENEIRALVIGEAQRKQLGLNGWNHARAYHDALAVRRRFKATLASAAASYLKIPVV